MTKKNGGDREVQNISPKKLIFDFFSSTSVGHLEGIPEKVSYFSGFENLFFIDNYEICLSHSNETLMILAKTVAVGVIVSFQNRKLSALKYRCDLRTLPKCCGCKSEFLFVPGDGEFCYKIRRQCSSLEHVTCLSMPGSFT
jgi:hypothetical protein